MTNNIHTIRRMAVHLNTLITGSKIVDCFTQEKGKLVVLLEECNDGNAIEFSAAKELPYIVLRKNYAKASKNAASVFPEIAGERIIEVKHVMQERAVEVMLENGMMLCFTFFASPNCYMIEDDKVRDSFKDSKINTGKDLESLFFRKEYSPVPEDDEDIIGYVKKNFPELGDVYRKELLYRIGIQPGLRIEEKERESMNVEAKAIYDEIYDDNYLIYVVDGMPVMSLAKLNYTGSEPHRIFEDLNSLVAYYSVSFLRKKRELELRRSGIAAITKNLKEVKRRRVSILSQLEQCRNSTLLQNCGEQILSNISEISKGQSVLHVTGIDGHPMEIKLKPELSPSQNAAVYFEKSKRQKASVEILGKKLIKAEKEIVRFENELTNFLSINEIKMLEKEVKREKAIESDETNRFRKFKVAGDYEVWVGKDSASNDLLTTRYSAQNDLWFHVRGSSGSHTVLKVNTKVEKVSKEAIVSAAAIAAYYSKARNAGNVPVAYCERKFVKKMKGFKQGSVVMQKEKVIFVKPSLPEE
jgi:predicted ribosome quality control (RQC) complex YloA/Tae2 family protein